MRLVFDVEGNYVALGIDPFFLHRYRLRCEGATAEEIPAREAKQREMMLNWAKLTLTRRSSRKAPTSRIDAILEWLSWTSSPSHRDAQMEAARSC